MSRLKSRIDGTSDEVSRDVVRRLEAGEAAVDIAKGLGLDAVGLVAAIARAGLGGEDSNGPSLNQSSPAYPRLEKALSDESVARLFPKSARPARLALAAGLLQILDFWDASHAAAQEADDLGERSTAAYWHMIAHRREPDAGNALYWARRVGGNPIVEPLVLAVRQIFGIEWTPASFIDHFTRTQPGAPLEPLARCLQRLEMIYLLEASLLCVVGSGQNRSG